MKKRSNSHNGLELGIMRLAMILSLLSAVGCTHYEYDLVRPPDVAQHIGTKEDVIVTVDPLEYRFRSYEDHLIVRVFNPTDDPIQLLGAQSTAVDPKGQSHPLRSATIESHSFVKLILPPVPAYVDPYGPSIGIGFGMNAQTQEGNRPLYLMNDGWHQHHFHRGFGYYGWSYWDPWYYDYYAPRYYVLYDENDTTFWDWRGESEVRLALAYERNGKTFRDEFAFRRVKMKN